MVNIHFVKFTNHLNLVLVAATALATQAGRARLLMLMVVVVGQGWASPARLEQPLNQDGETCQLVRSEEDREGGDCRLEPECGEACSPFNRFGGTHSATDKWCAAIWNTVF